MKRAFYYEIHLFIYSPNRFDMAIQLIIFSPVAVGPLSYVRNR
jgi:hypothetical protein